MLAFSPSTRTVATSLFPGLVLLIVYWLTASHNLPSVLTNFAIYSPYVIFGVALTLGWFFKRGRVFYTVFVLAFAYWLSNYASSSPLQKELIFNVLSFLLPVNLALIAILREQRNIVALRSLTILSVLLLQIVAVIRFYSDFPLAFIQLLNFSVIGSFDISTWLGLPIPTALTTLIALTLIGRQVWLQGTLLEIGLLWTLLGTTLALQARHIELAYPILISVSGLILIITLLKTWYNLAYLDELTGLPGRLALNELIKNLQGAYVVGMVDVDHFKKCNDTHGHDVGDQVLKLVASKLKNVTGGGKAFRYGGEEFSVIFPGRKIKDAFPHLSALREAIEDTQMILRNKPRPSEKPEIPAKRANNPLRYINVTVSIGIAEHDEQHQTAEQVFKAADEALYRAKDRGRNRLSM